MTDATLPLELRAIPVLMPSRIARSGPLDSEISPACPDCGSATVKRTMRSGPRGGLPFWGCVGFPGCRGTVDIETDEAAATTTADTSRALPASASRLDAATGPRALRHGMRADVATAARLAVATLARTSAAAMDRSVDATVRVVLPAARSAVSRGVDAALDVLHPAEAAQPVGGRNLAGASAQVEFERRRSRHRIKMRAALPTVVGITLILMVMAFLLLLGRGALIASLAAVAIAGAGVWAVGRLPVDALAPGRGAAGERRTAEFLDDLTAHGYVVLHDRLAPGIRSNIDHVAIGPAGVFVVETKNLRGKLTITGDKLFVGERTRTGVIDETYREAVAVQVCLADRLNELRSTVRPVLCIHRTVQLLLDNEVQGVRVVSGPQLVRYLRRMPALFDAETVQELAAAADSRLLPAVP